MKKTKKERRLEVLKDALKQVKANNYIATTGRVFYTYKQELRTNGENNDLEAKEILKKLLKDKDKKVCNVCARGALLVSTVHKENNFTLSDFDESDNGSFDETSTGDKRLLKLFSKQQLALMETAFEKNYYINDHILSPELNSKAIEFGDRYTSNNETLLAIFKNAIRNNGIFRP